MRFLAICFVALLFPGRGNGQISNEELTNLFAFHVKSIDDFFDRFNFRKNTGFQNYFYHNFPGYTLTRQGLIFNLFDSNTVDSLSSKTIRKFITEVTDTLNPQKLKYSDSAWYAVLKCKVLLKGKARKLTLVLKVERSKENTFRWAVVSANADFLKFRNTRADSIIALRSTEYDLYWMKRNRRYSFSPVSHGIDFMNLDNFFIHHQNANDYVYSGHRSFELNKLISLIQKSEIKFSRINTVTYYLMQLEDWVLVVEYINRQERNSGWLIKNIIRTTPEQKKIFMFDKLNIGKRES